MADYRIVVLACFLVNLTTFAGVAVLGSKATCTSTGASPHEASAHWISGALNGLAAGALLGSVAFLMLMESAHLVEEEWSDKDEADITWRWGTAVIAGFLIPFVGQILAETVGIDLVQCLRGSQSVADENGKQTELVGGSASESADEKVVTSASKGQGTGNSALFAVCVGDFFHNFTDGVFIGAAFELCSNKAGWAVAGAAVAHEVAQELADYVVLTSEQVGLSSVRALALNFITGISIILGGVLVIATDIHDGPLGLLLAIGAGSYIYLGAVVSMPAALAASVEHGDGEASGSAQRQRRHRLIVLVAFLIGVVAIGLVLLDHEHCEEDHGHEDDEEDHDDDEDEDHRI